ncbi:MAG: aspartyl/asparaginyl beta-hydroxylase domain-containing protein [Pseudomonadota bacterium]
MDIGVPYRDWPVDATAAREMVDALPAEAWDRNTFRQDVLADGAHNSSQAILFKHEWHPSASTSGLQHFEDLVYAWANERGFDPAPYMPILREDTDVWPIYTLPDWKDYESVLGPLVEQSIAPIKTKNGIVTRLALVRLAGGAKVAPHIDGQIMAEKAHRIHVPLSPSPTVEYKIGGKKFTMKMGRAYDFNNRWQHSVRNKGKRDRVNLFIDYYPNPGVSVYNPLQDLGPVYASAKAKRAN